jgi:hypothetical protein
MIRRAITELWYLLSISDGSAYVCLFLLLAIWTRLLLTAFEDAGRLRRTSDQRFVALEELAGERL